MRVDGGVQLLHVAYLRPPSIRKKQRQHNWFSLQNGFATALHPLISVSKVTSGFVFLTAIDHDEGDEMLEKTMRKGMPCDCSGCRSDTS
jgi:hypothetical protein